MPIQFVLFLVVFACAANHVVGQELDNGDEKYRSYRLPRLKVGRRDWPQWGGTSLHNNTPFGRQIPISWDVENITSCQMVGKTRLAIVRLADYRERSSLRGH